MSNLKQKLKYFFGNLFNKRTNELEQELNKPQGDIVITDGIPQVARQCSAESIVLLKNNGVLPFQSTTKVAVFGRCQYDYFYVGYGSGGDVHPPYLVSPLDALQQADQQGDFVLDKQLATTYKEWATKPQNIPPQGRWGHWPLYYEEMPIKKSTVQAVAKRNDVAIVIIGRAAGEDRENKLKKGSYYLTNQEKSLLKKVTSAFAQTVVILDCGNIIDLAWVESFGDKISAVLYAWQGGMESGNAIADVLTGKVNPSGRLSDTIARHYKDYPSASYFGGKDYNFYHEDIFVGYRYFQTFKQDKVLYPFGFGLSYTTFDIRTNNVAINDNTVLLDVTVTNTGKRDGKEVVQVYVEQPQGQMGKASRVLATFAKTDIIKAGKSVTLQLAFDKYDIASYDDTGASDFANHYVLEKGDYNICVGDNVRDAVVVHTFNLPQTEPIQPLTPICAVQEGYYRMAVKVSNNKLVPTQQLVVPVNNQLKHRILDNLPSTLHYTGDMGYKLQDVVDGKVSMEQFVAQLDDQQLEALTRGEGTMDSKLGTLGNAGAYGGVLQSLRDMGIQPVITTDGPAGIRLRRYCSLLPCGTALACTWNTALVEQLYTLVGKEMRAMGSSVLLAPGMNIHRNPLCGRNFEYFAEDPLLSGKMASAVVNGIQSQGVGACAKHFACNNQETNRNYNDSRVSERALREIYLKGFEICVKQSNPVNIMTSYNKINGVWSHYNYDLATTVLRQEWGYKGLVITDWWMRYTSSPEFPAINGNGYRVRAQVDILMPGSKDFFEQGYKSDGTLLQTLSKEGGITRGELQRTAINTLNTVIRLHKQ